MAGKESLMLFMLKEEEFLFKYIMEEELFILK